jgi:hypothetical protein
MVLPMETYSLLLPREEPIVAPAPLAAALSPVVGRPAGELSKRFREMPWVLLEGLPAAQLDAVFEVLRSRRLEARAVPDAHMPMLPPALRVRVADPTPESLFLESAEPPAPPVLRWGDLRVISCGIVALAAEEAQSIFGSWKGEKTSAQRLPAKDIPGSVPISTTSRTPTEALLADFFAGGAEPWRLRIDAGHFKYDCLGRRMSTSSRTNMRALLEVIRERAPKASLTNRAKLFLAGEPVSQFKFKTLTAFESYHRWVMQGFEEGA